MSEHLAIPKVNAILLTALSSAVGHLLNSIKRGLTISHQAMVTAFHILVGAGQFARSLQRASGLIDDACVPRKGNPQEWLERSLADDEAARRSARTQPERHG
jgi:hypothetical protein